MIDQVAEWIAEHRAELEGRGLDISVAPPTDDQPKKSIVVDIKTGPYWASVYCWETGECDMEIIDVGSDPRIPLKDRSCYWHHDFEDARQVDDALSRFLESLQDPGF